MTEPIPREYKPYLIASVTVLVLSLALLAGMVLAAFVYFSDAHTPLWVPILGGLAVLGILLGVGGFLGLMLVAGYRSWRESRRVEILPPAPRSS